MWVELFREGRGGGAQEEKGGKQEPEESPGRPASSLENAVANRYSGLGGERRREVGGCLGAQGEGRGWYLFIHHRDLEQMGELALVHSADEGRDRKGDGRQKRGRREVNSWRAPERAWPPGTLQPSPTPCIACHPHSCAPLCSCTGRAGPPQCSAAGGFRGVAWPHPPRCPPPAVLLARLVGPSVLWARGQGLHWPQSPTNSRPEEVYTRLTVRGVTGSL